MILRCWGGKGGAEEVGQQRDVSDAVGAPQATRVRKMANGLGQVLWSRRFYYSSHMRNPADASQKPLHPLFIFFLEPEEEGRQPTS